MKYTIQCTAENGQTGCFGYTGVYPSNYIRVTEVFPNLIEFYNYVRVNGLKIEF